MPESILFQAALKLAPSEREAFLNAACRDDQQLRSALEGLLRAHEDAGSQFLNPQSQTTPPKDTSNGAAPSILLSGKYKLVSE